MSHVHISIHTTVDGRQSVDHLPLFRKNWLWDPLQLHEIFPITYCSYFFIRQVKIRNHTTTDCPGKFRNEKLSTTWRHLGFDKFWTWKLVLSENRWAVVGLCPLAWAHRNRGEIEFHRASTWRSLEEPGKKFSSLDSLDSEFMGVWYFYNFLPVLRVNSSWIACL